MTETTVSLVLAEEREVENGRHVQLAAEEHRERVLRRRALRAVTAAEKASDAQQLARLLAAQTGVAHHDVRHNGVLRRLAQQLRVHEADLRVVLPQLAVLLGKLSELLLQTVVTPPQLRDAGVGRLRGDIAAHVGGLQVEADGGRGNQGDLAVVDAAIDLVLLHHAAQTQTQYLEGDRLDSAKQGRKREYRYSAAPCRRLLSTVCWLREAEMAITGMSTRCRSFFMRFRISSPDMVSRSQLISAMSY